MIRRVLSYIWWGVESSLNKWICEELKKVWVVAQVMMKVRRRARVLTSLAVNGVTTVVSLDTLWGTGPRRRINIRVRCEVGQLWL